SEVTFGLIDDDHDRFPVVIDFYDSLGGLTFSPDGRSMVLIGGAPPLQIYVFELPSLRLVFRRRFCADPPVPRPWTISPFSTPLPRHVAFSPDGSTLLCPFPTGHVVEFEFPSFAERRRWQAHASWVSALAGAPSSPDVIATGSLGGELTLWRMDWRQRRP